MEYDGQLDVQGKSTQHMNEYGQNRAVECINHYSYCSLLEAVCGGQGVEGITVQLWRK